MSRTTPLVGRLLVPVGGSLREAAPLPGTPIWLLQPSPALATKATLLPAAATEPESVTSVGVSA